MTEAEAIILANQGTIMSALGILVPNNSLMQNELIKAAEQTLKYVEKHETEISIKDLMFK